MNESLQTRIKSLPPLPESVQKIQMICNNPQSSIQELIQVVEKDPMLTANLLKAANSPLYGFSREIKSVAQAVSLFGMATVKGFALASAVRSNLKIDLSPYGISAETFANNSQLQSALMLNWYGKVDRTKLDVLAPASFLVGIGHVVIAAEVMKQGKGDQFKQALEEGQKPRDVEKAFFDTTSEHVTAAVFTHWRFEPAMIDAIEASALPAEADEEIRPYAYALKAIQTAIAIPGGLTDASVEEAKAFLQESEADLEPFEKAVAVVRGE